MEKNYHMEQMFVRGDENTRLHFFSTGHKGDQILGKYIHDINPDVKYIVGGAHITSQFPKTKTNLMDYIYSLEAALGMEAKKDFLPMQHIRILYNHQLFHLRRRCLDLT